MTDIAPRHGWAPCGERLLGETAQADGQSSSFIAAVRQDRDEAPWLFG